MGAGDLPPPLGLDQCLFVVFVFAFDLLMSFYLYLAVVVICLWRQACGEKEIRECLF